MRGKWFLFPVLIFLIFFSFTLSSRAEGENDVPVSDLELAEQYAPVLYFHEDEIFRPQPVEVLIENARLRQDRSFWFDLNLLNSVVTTDLVTYKDPTIFLDIWYGSAGQSDYKNYSAHRAYYSEQLSPDAGGPPTTIYAYITQDTQQKKTILQYWLFYYYNDWFNKHEGDWELVQIILDEGQNPEWVILSQHHGGTRRNWEDTKVEDLTHPAVYVALGSHANYFWENEIYPNSMQIGTKQVAIPDRTGNHGRIIPQVTLLPSTEEISSALEDYSSVSWLIFNGHWGELSLQGDFGGPSGPTTKGDQWENPYLWGMEQPLDIETWYQNRLKILVENDQPANFTIQGNPDIADESTDIGSNFLLLHEDPPEVTTINLVPANSTPTFISVAWPDRESETIEEYQFTDLFSDQNDKFEIQFTNGSDLNFYLEDQPALPSSQRTESATWDIPDLVWFAGYLPASQIVLGLTLAIVAGIFPGLMYLLLIYHFDRYEKEPLKLVFTVLLWGSIPSILVGILVQVFFTLPPEFLSAKIIEVIQTGLISPFTEEAIKGAILVFIAIRHRNEINDTLDGIVYGAIVGIGFAISGNTISYIGSFLIRGFQGLGIVIFVEGLLSGLNHALYSSIFGAGLAFYISKNRDRKSIWIPAGAFLLAVIANGLHELLTSTVVNQPVIAILINWSGILSILVIMFLERKQEIKIIQENLHPEIPKNIILVILHRKNQQALYRGLPFSHRLKYRKALRKQINRLTELAFLKKTFSQTPSEETRQEIDRTRQQIITLNQETNLLEDLSLNSDKPVE